MKKQFEFLKNSGLLMIVIMLLCSIFGIGSGYAMTADAVPGAAGGVNLVDEISTEEGTRQHVPGLNLNEIEKKVVVIRPMGNPLEQISRYVTRRKSSSRNVQYYATDVLPVKTTIANAYTAPTTGNGSERVTLNTNNNSIFSAKETVFFPEIMGWNEAGTAQTEQYLMGYITSKTTDKKLVIKIVNGQLIGSVIGSPSIPLNSPIIRAGRAHNEIDIQTAPFANVPTKSTQFLQSFKAQIEQTTMEKIANKEADWTFSDIEQEAIFDMKRGMNKNYLVGAKAIIYDDDDKEVYLTGGILWQAGKKFIYGSAGTQQITFEELVKLTESAFTGNAGNKEKVFLVGSGLLTNLSLISYGTNQKNAATTVVEYGITFKEITTNFGTLWVIHDESFDEIGLTDTGLVIDVEFLRKYSIEELHTDDLDLRKAGDRNVDARTISEISGLVLQNPNAHIRVVKYA